MIYLFARYTKRLLLVPIGVLFIINPVYSGESGSASDGLCNYCAEHNSGALRVGEISTAYVPMRGFTEEPALARQDQSVSKPETQAPKSVFFVRPNADTFVKKYPVSHMSNASDGLCNYCGDYVVRHVASIRFETSYIPLAGYNLEAPSPGSPDPSKYAGY